MLFHNNSNPCLVVRLINGWTRRTWRPTDLPEVLELVDLKMLPLVHTHSGSSLHYDLINEFDVFLKYHGDLIWSRAICFAFVFVCDCAQPVWPHQNLQSLSLSVFVCVWAEQVHLDIKLSPSQLLHHATESSSLRDTAEVTNFNHFEPRKKFIPVERMMSSPGLHVFIQCSIKIITPDLRHTYKSMLQIQRKLSIDINKSFSKSTFFVTSLMTLKLNPSLTVRLLGSWFAIRHWPTEVYSYFLIWAQDSWRIYTKKTLGTA